MPGGVPRVELLPPGMFHRLARRPGPNVGRAAVSISLIVPGMVNREDVADGAVPGVSPQRPFHAPKPGCEGQGLTNDN